MASMAAARARLFSWEKKLCCAGWRRWKTTVPTMPHIAFQPKPYTGIGYENCLRIRKENLSPALTTFYKKPLLLTQGYMQWAFDQDGRRYLDMFSGICTVSVGHANPTINKALQEQQDLLWHSSSIYLHPKLHEYAEKLANKFPGNLKVLCFTNSGSEANDLAMLMARLYTGNFDLITLRNAYHGHSPYVQGLTSLSTWKYNYPNGFGVHAAMNPDPYRGLWGGNNCRDSPIQTNRKCHCEAGTCQAADMYIDQLQEVFTYSLPRGKIAGFFAESIQGYGGIVQFPRTYLKRAYEMVRSNGGLCIADEVQTGFGRTGETYWGFEAHDVMPDIVTMAKGIGNGFPLAAVVTTPEIAQTLTRAITFNTFGGNALACATAISVLDFIDEHKLQVNCEVTGTHFLKNLSKLRDEFSVVGDVRGKGLMIGIEMVTDKKSRQPLQAADMNAILEHTKELGLLIGKGGMFGNVFRLQPSMIVTKDDCDFCVDVLRHAIRRYQNE